MIISGDDTCPVLEHCHIHHNEEEGVLVRKGAVPHLRECRVESNQDGILVKDAAPIVENCQVSNHREGRGRGLLIYGGSCGVFKQCDIFDNEHGTPFMMPLNKYHQSHLF